jgi:primosomal replication protein N
VSLNQLEIIATVSERTAMRYTPAGIEVLTLTLDHQSEQRISGSALAPRKIALQLKAQLFGLQAQKAQAASLVGSYVFKGFLAPMRVGSKVLWLTVNEFSKVDEA